MAEKLTVEEILALARQVLVTVGTSSGGQFNLSNTYQENKDWLAANPGLLAPAVESAVYQTPIGQHPEVISAIIDQAAPRLTDKPLGLARDQIAGGFLKGMGKKTPLWNIGATKELAKIVSREVEDRRAGNFGGAQGLWT